jgi:hypothetical protein
MKQRTADPYRDLDVIDSRAPRFNQATVGVLSLAAVVTGWWGILAVLAAQLAVGLAFGRRWCLPCVVYFELVQPRLGEGPIEDARPPRFANVIGAGVLAGAALAYAAGVPALGFGLGALVAGLALLAAATGFCAGCEVYRLGAHARGVRSHRLERVDLPELGVASNGEVVVQFTHPLCTDCRALERRLRVEGRSLVTVDVSRRPELARKYGIAVVPTAVAVDGTGAVTTRLAG